MTERYQPGIELRPVLTAAAIMVAFGAAAPREAAAQAVDERWVPWIGCWQPAQPTGSEDDGEASNVSLCFVQGDGSETGPAAMHLLSIEDGVVLARESLHPGYPMPAETEDCQGTETTTLAPGIGQIYVNGTYRCQNGVTRESSGMLAMVSQSKWIDAQVVTIGGQRVTWVTDYIAVSDAVAEAAGVTLFPPSTSVTVRTMRMAAAEEPSVADVVDASENVEPEAVHAWQNHLDAPTWVDSRALTALADGGVDPNVIDLMVARSYPEYFSGGSLSRRTLSPRGYIYDPYYGAYGAYPGGWGYYSPLGYSGWGPAWGPYGGYGRIYGGYGTVITVQGQDRDGGGRAVAGEGYRSPTRQSGNSGSSGDSGSRGSVNPPSSSGSSGSSTGRTARRRGGGG